MKKVKNQATNWLRRYLAGYRLSKGGRNPPQITMTKKEYQVLLQEYNAARSQPVMQLTSFDGVPIKVRE